MLETALKKSNGQEEKRGNRARLCGDRKRKTILEERDGWFLVPPCLTFRGPLTALPNKKGITYRIRTHSKRLA